MRRRPVDGRMIRRLQARRADEHRDFPVTAGLEPMPHRRRRRKSINTLGVGFKSKVIGRPMLPIPRFHRHPAPASGASGRSIAAIKSNAESCFDSAINRMPIRPQAPVIAILIMINPSERLQVQRPYDRL